MTPTLLSASSAAYLATPAATSDNASAPVDGSTLSATGSEESSDDHGEDVAPSDFAVLLAAMMAPVSLAPLRPRVDPVDAANTSVVSAAVGDTTAVTSVGLASLVALPPTVGETSDANRIGADVETPLPVNLPPSTTPSPPTREALGAITADPIGTIGVPAGADQGVDRTVPMRSEAAASNSVEAATETTLAGSRVAGRESLAPMVGLVALDRPLSLGRRSSLPSPEVADALVEAPVDASMEVLVDVVAPHDSPAPAIDPQDGLPSVEASPVGPVKPETVPTPAAGPAGPPTVTLSVPPNSRLVPRSVDDDAPVVTSADGDATPMSIVKDTPAPTASTGTSPQNSRTPNLGTDAMASHTMQSVTTDAPIRVVREAFSAPSDEDDAPSPVAVSGTPGPGSPAERSAGVGGSTFPVVEGVRPGEAYQHIVRAAQRAQAADGPQHMRLEMHPGDLGAVAVEVTIEGGAVHVAMVAERGETKDLLRSSIAELRSSLVAAGFSAGRIDIQSGLSDGRFGQAADRHDAWSQSFDRPDSHREQSGAFANMFDQSSGRGDQSRSSRTYFGTGDRGDALSSLRSVGNGDRTARDATRSANGLHRDRLDLQL